MKLVSVAEMKEIERRAVEEFGLGMPELMLNAGQSVFNAIVNVLGLEQLGAPAGAAPGLIIVLAGPGNNGGDAMVTAALIRNAFPALEIKIYFYNRSRPDDPAGFNPKLTHTAAEYQDGLDLADTTNFDLFEADLYAASLVVDGLLGASASRPASDLLAEIIEAINEATETREFDQYPLRVVAIDVPTGINAETGQPSGPAIKADLTVTLGMPKKGLYTYEAVDYTGRVVLGDIGLVPELVDDYAGQGLELITSYDVRAGLPPRPLTGHKGTFGKLMVLSGSEDYLGAPYLCTSAGMRAGAGLVTLAAPGKVVSILATKLSENTFMTLPEIESEDEASFAASQLSEKLEQGEYRVLLVGPGLGNDNERLALMRDILEIGQKLPRLVIDADGLNMLSQIPDWWKSLQPNNILTPHPAELARLLKTTNAEIGKHRQESAQEAARKFNQIVILKGAYTLVAAPDGRIRLNPASNPALATAGSGDILAGICAGILTQLLRDPDADAFEAACVSVYLHALAGDLARRTFGDTGVLAGDLLPYIPQGILALKKGYVLE